MNLPLTLTVQGLTQAMVAKPGVKTLVHLMVTTTLGKLEGALRAATDYVLIFDRSGSTANIIKGGEVPVLEAAKEAAFSVIEKLNDDDTIAVIQFNARCDEQDVLLGSTKADKNGKVKAGNAIDSIISTGSTAFEPALTRGRSLLRSNAGRKQAILFFTDGQNMEGGDPIPVSQELQAAGISLFVGGLNVNNEGEKLLEAMAGTNFRSLNSADEVAAFFSDAQNQAASAAVTNARLRVSPVNFVQLNSLELVVKNNAPNYVTADASGQLVNLGEIAVDDNLQSYLALQVILPADIKAGRRSFGKIELVGDVASQGIKDQALTSTNIVVTFADQPIPGLNRPVQDMINIAATARELYRAGQSGNAADMQSHVAAARKTVAFSSSDVAKALAAQIALIEGQAKNDPEAAAKQARRATKAFSAADVAAAMANLGKK